MEEKDLEEIRELLKSITIIIEKCPLVVESQDESGEHDRGYICGFTKGKCSYNGLLYSPTHFTGGEPFCLQELSMIGTLKRYVALQKFVYGGGLSIQRLRYLYERDPSIIFKEKESVF